MQAIGAPRRPGTAASTLGRSSTTSMLLKASSASEARAARAAEDAEEERRQIARSTRREMFEHARRLERRVQEVMQQVGDTEASREARLKLDSEQSFATPTPLRAPAIHGLASDDLTQAEASSPVVRKADLAAVVDRIPVVQVVTSAISAQLPANLEGASSLERLRALTRPELMALLSRAKLEGLGDALWAALLMMRYEEGYLFSREDMAVLQRAQRAAGGAADA